MQGAPRHEEEDEDLDDDNDDEDFDPHHPVRRLAPDLSR